jgi:hypothetical protein
VLTAVANRHPDTMGTPNRRATADAAAPTAPTASANAVPAASGSTASTTSVTAKAVNAARTDSAREPNRRSHPRTVDGARPNRIAIARCPRPAALSINAEPITATVSARRANASTSSNTCVTSHRRQRPRRGRTRNGEHRSLSDLARAHPHGASTPPHGQARSPARNPRSTAASSTLTVNTGEPPTARQQPSRTRASNQDREGCTHQDVTTVLSEHQNGQPHQELPVQHVQDR